MQQLHDFANDNPLLERNETRRVGSTNTWPTVLDRLAIEGENKISLVIGMC